MCSHCLWCYFLGLSPPLIRLRVQLRTTCLPPGT